MSNPFIDPATIGRNDVLVLRALGLGDAVTGIAAMRSLSRAFPGRRLVLAADEDVGGWLVGLGVVDAVCVTEDLRPLPAMAGGHLAVDLHGNGPASRDILRATGPRGIVGFWYPGCPEEGPRWCAEEHEVLRWCRLVATLGGGVAVNDLRLRPRPRVAAPTSRFPRRGSVTGGRRVIVHPGAASASRRWGAARWGVLVRHLVEDGHCVIVTGDASEQLLCAEVVEAAGPRVRAAVHDTSGRLGLPMLAAKVADADLVLSGDTGIAHLAIALAVPSVTLFGPTSPLQWGPILDLDLHTVLWTGRGHDAGDPHGDRIDARLDAVTVAVVLTAAREALASAHRAPSHLRRTDQPEPRLGMTLESLLR